MDWLSRLVNTFPEVKFLMERRKITRFTKLDVYELEECKPKIIRREIPFWRTDRLDKFHLMPDGSFTHHPL